MAEAAATKGNSKEDPRTAMMNKASEGAKKVIAKHNPNSATAKAQAAAAATATPAKTAKLKPGVPSTPAAIAAAKKAAAKDAPANVAVGKPKDTSNTTGKGKKPVKAPIVTEAPAKAAKGAKPAAKVPNAKSLEKLMVAEPDKERRGEMAEYVAVAKKFKNGFTRDQLHESMVKAGKDDKAARIKIGDGVYFKVFVPVA